jgi:hypothetical protein
MQTPHEILFTFSLISLILQGLKAAVFLRRNAIAEVLSQKDTTWNGILEPFYLASI